MYRQNKLKEELDRLRLENKRLELENVYLNQRNQVLECEIQNMRLQTQLKNLSDEMIMKLCLNPRLITLDEHGFDGSFENSEEGKQKLKELKEVISNKDWRITYDN